MPWANEATRPGGNWTFSFSQSLNHQVNIHTNIGRKSQTFRLFTVEPSGGLGKP